MKQTPEPQPLTPEPKTPRTARDDMQTAEPYWMQNIRLAQRAIEEARARLRAAQSSDSSEPE